MKRFPMEHGLIGIDEEPLRVPLRIKDQEVIEWGATSADLFEYILANCLVETQRDALMGGIIFKAIKKAQKDGVTVLEIEEGAHDWFKPLAEKMTPKLLRLNAPMAYEFIKEGFEKTKAKTSE